MPDNTPGYFTGRKMDPSEADKPEVRITADGNVLVIFRSMGQESATGWIAELLKWLLGEDRVQVKTMFRMPLEQWKGGVFSKEWRTRRRLEEENKTAWRSLSGVLSYQHLDMIAKTLEGHRDAVEKIRVIQRTAAALMALETEKIEVENAD